MVVMLINDVFKRRGLVKGMVFKRGRIELKVTKQVYRVHDPETGKFKREVRKCIGSHKLFAKNVDKYGMVSYATCDTRKHTMEDKVYGYCSYNPFTKRVYLNGHVFTLKEK